MNRREAIKTIGAGLTVGSAAVTHALTTEAKPFHNTRVALYLKVKQSGRWITVPRIVVSQWDIGWSLPDGLGRCVLSKDRVVISSHYHTLFVGGVVVYHVYVEGDDTVGCFCDNAPSIMAPQSWMTFRRNLALERTVQEDRISFQARWDAIHQRHYDRIMVKALLS